MVFEKVAEIGVTVATGKLKMHDKKGFEKSTSILSPSMAFRCTGHDV